MEGEDRTKSSTSGFVPLVSVVDFHHARGPEVETWFGTAEDHDPVVDYEWFLLPFMALSDGAHASTEDFSYFTLLRPSRPNVPATSLFGISCTRQIPSSQLSPLPLDVTRSTVQKAVVVIADSPQFFGMLRERLGVVTAAWFEQQDFRDTEILRRFQESLAEEKTRDDNGDGDGGKDREEYLGMSLRELVREFRWQTLVLFKCCLLQPKMLLFGTRCERLCMMQFSLISLIPGLLRNLQDCADPELDAYERNLVKPTSLKTSDRISLLNYMGLPLQIFGRGSLFGPYTPLQQLDILADHGTKSYIVGSTNSLLLQQRDRYSDILINLDEDTISITSTSLRAALTLSAADRRWIDFITQSVNDTWDDANPQRPKTMGYVGSEEFIRLQFEEYLLSALSSVKCHNYLQLHAHNSSVMLPQVDGDPANDFGIDWIEAWSHSENYRIWNKNTDSHLFDIVEPKHPCAGGLTIDDVQRRIAEQVKDLHLDERFAVGKEVIGKNLEAGREKLGTVFNKLYSDMEALRESQRRRQEENRREQEKAAALHLPSPSDSNSTKPTQSKVSWGTWLGEKRKIALGRISSTTPSPTLSKEKENEKPLPITPLQLESPKPKSYNESLFQAEEPHKTPTNAEHERNPLPVPPKQSKFHEEMDIPVDNTLKSMGTGMPLVREMEPSKFHEEMESSVDIPLTPTAATPVRTASSEPEVPRVVAEESKPLPEALPEKEQEKEAGVPHVVAEESKAWKADDEVPPTVDRSEAVAAALGAQI
ncbi:transport protein Avl9-domain-containing protein [Calycina marina]|uniref:Transport protein Avl9-domain-containing protein n=1 Tax=Calycina marina TaxID=1763456 RepID=A0A9P8CGI4_9HELO|nr:transport protein Avl9-domain-containing protein [Calycina marina]